MEPARPAWFGRPEESAAAPGVRAQAARVVARSAPFVMLEEWAAWLVMLAERLARVAEPRVRPLSGFGKLRQGGRAGQNQARAPAPGATESAG